MSRRKRIYIFPNRYGFLGFGIFLLGLAVAATYQNNLVFMMAFVLLSLGLIAILQTARNVRDVEVVKVEFEPKPAGQTAAYQIWVRNFSDFPKYNLRATIKGDGWTVSGIVPKLGPQDSTVTGGTLTLPEKRGLYRSRRVELRTVFPYSLFNSWTRDKVEAEVIAYPVPVDRAPARRIGGATEDEFSHHRPFETGDRMNRIDWKLSTRVDKLHVRQFVAGQNDEIIIDFEQISLPDVEGKLAQMAHWMKQAEINGRDYQLRLPNFVSELNHGPAHFRVCAAKLAGYSA